MSYMRGRFYVYGDGERVHLWVLYPEDNGARKQAKNAGFINGIAIPVAIFDEIVARRADEDDFQEEPFNETEAAVASRELWYGPKWHAVEACGCVTDTEYACQCSCHPDDYVDRDETDESKGIYQE